MKLSIVIPVFNEEEGLPSLTARLNSFLSSFKVNFEVIFVDDHSIDKTPMILKEICEKNDNYSYLRLSKNSGSHIAIIAGLSYAKGDCSVFLASDLQDPPELIAKMVEKWKAGNRIVWAVRKQRKKISLINKFLSGLFYKIFNSISTVNLPPKGSDFALLDKSVVTAILKSAGSKPSLGALIAWCGFNQTQVFYVKEQRKFGKSKWNLARKLTAFADAFVGFSYIPLRAMTYFGFFISLIGFISAIVVIILKVTNKTQIAGWASLMVILFVIGGIQMIMLGILGEYLWRNIEETRKRPLFFIEESLNNN